MYFQSLDIQKKILKSINESVLAVIKNFLDNKDQDIFRMSMKIIDGFNENEVSIVPKNTNNKGFFVRFFNFFN